MKLKHTLLMAVFSLLISALTAQAAPIPSSSATPVNVVDARNAAQQQINITATGTGTASSAGSGTGTGSIPIPAGKIFVLEFVSFSLSYTTPPSGEGISIQDLSISVNGPHIDGSNGPIEYQLLIPTSIDINNTIIFTGNQVLRLYAQPGTTIDVHFTVQSAGGPLSASASVSLSGYFVKQ